MEHQEKPSPWYQEGLRFECTQCGQCCTGAPGYTWVSEKEIETIAAHLQMEIAEFVRRYLKKVGDRWSLLEHPKTYDCVFLKDKKCQIYSIRPRQCRTFPWWAQNLKSPEAWERAGSRCEGIHSDAPVVAFGVIQKALENDS